MEPDDTRKDYFRTAPGRYFGLSYEIMQVILPFFTWRILPIGQTIRNVYITMDVYDKTSPKTNTINMIPAVVAAFDVLAFHALASIIFPGIAMRVIRQLVYKSYLLPPMPQVITLSTIPLIVPLGDQATNALLDATYRDMFGRSY